MNFFTIGFRDVNRRLQRQRNRLALTSARQVLREGETALGRVAWRQLRDEEGLPEPLGTLRRMDAETRELAAHVSELESKVQVQQAEYERARQDGLAALERLEARRRPLRQQADALQAKLDQRQAALVAQEQRASELEAERMLLMREQAALQAEPRSTPDEFRAFEMRRRELAARRAVIPEQLTGLHRSRVTLLAPLPALESERQQVRAGLLELERQEQGARTEQSTRQRNATINLTNLQREIGFSRRRAALIEEHLQDSYWLAGQRLGDRPGPPGKEGGSAELFEEVGRQRQAVRSLTELGAMWVQESREANRQDLRIFYFVTGTFAVLLGLSLLLVFRSPPTRDYLPERTEAVISLNVGRFSTTDFLRALPPSQQPDVWQHLWAGLTRKIGEVPLIDPRQVTRVTRALTDLDATGPAPPTDYLLVELPSVNDTDELIRRFVQVGSAFRYEYSNGLAAYERGNSVAVARIGPQTLAVGSVDAVHEMIRVRLGLSRDMKVDASFLNEFQRLDRDSALRLVTSRPVRLTALADPLLDPAILERCQSLGVAVDCNPPQGPISVLFLLRAATSADAADLAARLRDQPAQALGFRRSFPDAFADAPRVAQHERGVEWRFRLTAGAAREFLLRISRLGLTGETAAVAAHPTPGGVPGAAGAVPLAN